MKQERAVREAMAVAVACLEGCSGVSSSNDQSSSCLIHQIVQACKTDPGERHRPRKVGNPEDDGKFTY